jgi:hypothetical protein
MYEDSLYHHGILGQKWGVRRFQNKDGSLTQAGKARQETYSKSKDLEKKRDESFNKMLAKADEIIKNNKQLQKAIGSTKNVDDEELLYQAINEELSPNSKEAKEFNAAYNKYWDDRTESRRFNSANKKEIAEGKKITDKIVNGNKNVNTNSDTVKKVAKIGGAIAVTAIAAYGGYKLSKAIKAKAADSTPHPFQNQGIKTVEPNRIKVNTVEPNRVNLNTSSSTISNTNERLQSTLNQMKSINTSNKSVSDANNQYVYDLIRKNTQALSSLGF